MGGIDRDGEWVGQLTDDGLDDRANGSDAVTERLRPLTLLVGGQGAELEAIMAQQVAGQLRAELAGANAKSSISPPKLTSTCSLKPKLVRFGLATLPKSAAGAAQSPVAPGTR